MKAGRLLALALGSAVALGILGVFEARARALEKTEGLVIPHDQPGRKYAISPIAPGTRHKSYQLNSDGFRDREFSREKTPGRIRVAVLGDSVTFGAVAGVDAVWTRIAQDELVAAGHDVEVYNFAIHGYDIQQVAATLRYVVWDFAPDLVVYGYFTNDHIPSRLLRLGDGEGVYVHLDTDVDPESAVGPASLARWGVRHSALFRQVQGARLAHREGDARIDDTLLSPQKIPRVDGTPFVATHLDAMIADAAEHSTAYMIMGIAPHVLGTPDMGHCDRFRFPGFCQGQFDHLKTLERMVKARNAVWLDTIQCWRTSGKPYYFPEDQQRDPLHPGIEGHAVLGRWFARHVVGLWPGLFGA